MTPWKTYDADGLTGEAGGRRGHDTAHAAIRALLRSFRRMEPRLAGALTGGASFRLQLACRSAGDGDEAADRIQREPHTA